MLSTDLHKHNTVIGIIGGTGLEATAYFQLELIKNMQRELKPLCDIDYIPILIDNDPRIPDRSAAIINNTNNMAYVYADRIFKLQQFGANIFIITCNTAHTFIDKIINITNANIVNIVKEAASDFAILNSKIKKVGLLATLGSFRSKVYHNEFARHNIIIEEPDEITKIKIHQAIYGIKAGFINREDAELEKIRLNEIYLTFNISNADELSKSPKEILIDSIIYYHNKGINHIILGCTELIIALDDFEYPDIKLYDPSKAASIAAINYCKKMNIGTFGGVNGLSVLNSK